MPTIPPLSLPITNPVLVFAIAMGIFLLAPLIAQRFNVSGLIGIIVAGAIVGPNALGLLARDDTIVLLGTVGLLYLMFLAGVGIDLDELRRHRNRSILFGVLTFGIPQLLGIPVGLALGYALPSAILLASMFGSHTLVAYPIAHRFGLAKLAPVTTVVGGTLISDTSALLVLTVLAASALGTLDSSFWIRLIVLLSIYVALVLLVLPRVARWFFRRGLGGTTAEWVFVIAMVFLGAYLAEVAGIVAIVGAFLVGLALNRLIPERGLLSNRLHFVGDSLLIPFFLLSVGMLVDVRVVAAGPRVWLVMLGMTVTVTFTKGLAALLAGKLFGFSWSERLMMFGLSVPQAAATLAATLIGYEVGLFDDAILNGSVLMILVTCTLGPWLVEKHGRDLALREEQETQLPSVAPQRILVPMANPATARGLMDLALLVHGTGTNEPILPLAVVPGEGEGALVHVATAEKMLSHAVSYAAGAAVPVQPITRVDNNFAAGITRAITETRSSLVIIGWDGKRSRSHGIFGSVLDQLLERTSQHVIVARLSQPLNITQRLLLLIPPGADHDPGFFDAAAIIKMLGSRIGAPIRALVIGGESDTYARHLTTIRPTARVDVEAVPSWHALNASLVRRLIPDDLVVVLSARPGALSWHRELERLPSRLSSVVAGGFLVLYPREPDATGGMAGRIGGLPRALAADRTVLDLPDGTFADALERLLTLGLKRQRALQADARTAFREGGGGQITEILPGVVVPHARLDELSEAILCLGTSPAGIAVPGISTPAHLLFVLLSPADHPEEQLELLAEIATLASDPDVVARLASSRNLDEVQQAVASSTAPPLIGRIGPLT